MDLVISLDAVKQIKAIPAADAQPLIKALKDIAAAYPRRLSFATELAGGSGEWRARKGDYRAIYRIEDDTMKVIAAGHRRDIYR